MGPFGILGGGGHGGGALCFLQIAARAFALGHLDAHRLVRALTHSFSPK
jgi:hypothetical protein